MKMLMENWNQFVAEEMSKEDKLEAALEKQGFDPEMADRLADELMDEEEILAALSKMNESAKEAGAMTGSYLGAFAYVAAQVRDAMNSGLAQDEIAQMLSNDPTIPGALAAAIGVAGVVAIKRAIEDAMRDPAEKEREIYRRKMEEGMKEMSDDEKEILTLLEDVSAPDVVVALENWIRGGKHTMDDLHMHLGKMMS